MSGIYSFAQRASLALAMSAAVGCGGKLDDGADDGGSEQSRAYPAPIEQGAAGPAQGIARLNEYREMAGLAAATLDAEASTACLGHVRYLIAEAELTGYPGCLLDHGETNHNNPYYSAAHEQTGLGALLACVPPQSGGLRTARAVDRWIGSLYHRIPLLSPGLSRVGVAEHEGYVCLHYAQGTKPLTAVHLVTWPADGAMDVPVGFPGLESPCPSAPANPLGTPAEQCPPAGFIMTATWYGPPGSGPLTGLHAAAARYAGAGTVLGVLGVYADGVAGRDPAPGAMSRTVALVPAASLPASSSIGVDFEVDVDGRSQAARWSFSTGNRQE